MEILPSTIPPKFWVDAFVAIHADGSTDTNKSGFKAANPRRDFTGKTSNLLAFIEGYYEDATGFEKDPNITRNMTGYYAFAWWRYDHAIHPITPAVILETGFLTSHHDYKIITARPELAALGLADGILKYLETQRLIDEES